MDSDKAPRDRLGGTDKDEKPPRDRDQAPYSPARAQDKADHAEFSDTTGAQDKPDSDEPLVTRDNMKGVPPRRGST